MHVAVALLLSSVVYRRGELLLRSLGTRLGIAAIAVHEGHDHYNYYIYIALCDLASSLRLHAYTSQHEAGQYIYCRLA